MEPATSEDPQESLDLLTPEQMRDLTTDEAFRVALALPFNNTYSRTVQGTSFTYITGEQATSRLNAVLGIFNWTFRVIEHGYREDADEMWALGELTIYHPADRAVTVTRQQFGSQKLKRRKSDQQVLDIGFDLKGAATDAFKKCATQVGVGLYLSRKETAAFENADGVTGAPRQVANTSRPSSATPTQTPPPQLTLVAPRCEACNAEVAGARFKDGTEWSASDVANRGRVKFGKVLCMNHYRSATEAQKAEEAKIAAAVAEDLNGIPF